MKQLIKYNDYNDYKSATSIIYIKPQYKMLCYQP